MARETCAGFSFPKEPWDTCPYMADPRLTDECLIYFLGDEDGRFIKIGATKHLLDRLTRIQSNCPLKLTVLKELQGTYELEQLLLSIFSRFRIHGEWFEADPVLVQFIERLRDKQVFAPHMLVQN